MLSNKPEDARRVSFFVSFFLLFSMCANVQHEWMPLIVNYEYWLWMTESFIREIVLYANPVSFIPRWWAMIVDFVLIWATPFTFVSLATFSLLCRLFYWVFFVYVHYLWDRRGKRVFLLLLYYFPTEIRREKCHYTHTSV